MFMKKKKGIKKRTLKPAKRDLLGRVVSLIENAKTKVAVTINSELVLLYRNIGRIINHAVLKDQRGEYGEETIATLAAKLTSKYGSGWSKRHLWNCVRSADTFTERQIVSAVRAQLSWTHLKSLLFIEDPLKRQFYLQMAEYERWSTRELQDKIDSMLYERTALSKKPEKLIKSELKSLGDGKALTENLVFRDPYVFDFLGLKDVYSEQDIETAILIELQKFITEMGNDFAFLARQKRITIDNEDYRIDLLFYHRSLRRLVVIDLKLGKFKASHKGQMELYLRWLEKHEVKLGEEEPIGLILCADKSDEHVELLLMKDQRIKVAQYLTQLPSKKVLMQKLHKAIEIARKKEEMKHKDTNNTKRKKK